MLKMLTSEKLLQDPHVDLSTGNNKAIIGFYKNKMYDNCRTQGHASRTN